MLNELYWHQEGTPEPYNDVLFYIWAYDLLYVGLFVDGCFCSYQQNESSIKETPLTVKAGETPIAWAYTEQPLTDNVPIDNPKTDLVTSVKWLTQSQAIKQLSGSENKILAWYEDYRVLCSRYEYDEENFLYPDIDTILDNNLEDLLTTNNEPMCMELDFKNKQNDIGVMYAEIIPPKCPEFEPPPIEEILKKLGLD